MQDCQEPIIGPWNPLRRPTRAMKGTITRYGARDKKEEFSPSRIPPMDL